MSEHAASTVVARYLSALAASDLDRARGLLAEDFMFRGPGMERAVDRETFLSELAGKYDHVDRLRVVRQAESHGLVASLYELDARTPHGATTFLMTEWNTVRDGASSPRCSCSTLQPARNSTLGATRTPRSARDRPPAPVARPRTRRDPAHVASLVPPKCWRAAHPARAGAISTTS